MSDKQQQTINLRFHGIDSWNRPVFKSELGYFYGSTDKLFSFSGTYKDTEADIRNEITSDDIEYFGRSFGCEPMGGRPRLPIVFIWSDDEVKE